MGRAYEVRKASIAKTGAAKAKIYSNYAKEIYQYAKSGGTDPEGNLALKHLIEKAKKEQVPADIIKRAIDKVNSGVDENYQSLRYEGFASGNATIIVDCLTDNVNRAVSLVRNAFTKSKAKMGVAGCVSHMYENLSIVVIKNITEDEALEALINSEVDAKDIEKTEETVTIYGNPSDLVKIKTAVTDYNDKAEFLVEEVTMVPNEMVKLIGEDLDNFNKLLLMLEDTEDVQKVYHNVELE
ncbi:MAG: YebC/PmpR family DNA-binding transcriptional regulator [Bacilli bacterium]